MLTNWITMGGVGRWKREKNFSFSYSSIHPSIHLFIYVSLWSHRPFYSRGYNLLLPKSQHEISLQGALFLSVKDSIQKLRSGCQVYIVQQRARKYTNKSMHVCQVVCVYIKGGRKGKKREYEYKLKQIIFSIIKFNQPV